MKTWAFLLACGVAVSAFGCSSDSKDGDISDEEGPGEDPSKDPPPPVSLDPVDPASKLSDGAHEPVEPELPGCGIESGYPGDEYCIKAPPAEKGFQVHYGPSDYDDPDEVAQYTIEPSGETNQFLPAVAGNTEDVFFYGRQYRMRPGSHHLIVSESGGAGGGAILGTGRRLGGTQNAVKDNPAGGLAPENQGIGMPLKANAPLSLSLHYFNSSEQVLLKEIWVNFWYVDSASVEQQASEVFIWVQGAAVEPGSTSTILGVHDIAEAGRVLTMYGHRHSNNVRFSAYRTRGEERELVYDDYDWEEPTVVEFNSAMLNPEPSLGSGSPGGHTGMLDLQPGDKLEWECEIQNKHDYAITFGENEAATSEMCILVGDAIGPALFGFHPGVQE